MCNPKIETQTYGRQLKFSDLDWGLIEQIRKFSFNKCQPWRRLPDDLFIIFHRRKDRQTNLMIELVTQNEAWQSKFSDLDWGLIEQIRGFSFNECQP